jgi:hypothetical protein
MDGWKKNVVFLNKSQAGGKIAFSGKKKSWYQSTLRQKNINPWLNSQKKPSN